MERADDSVGVIVGRLQVAVLHAGHQYIIETALGENKDVIVFLGTNGVGGTARDPLPFELRKSMLENAYADITVAEIADQPSNEAWSAALDAAIAARYPNQRVRLYGSRDSFLDSYEGRYERRPVEHLFPDSGSQARDEIARKKNPSAAFREGIIYAHANRPSIINTIVGVGIVQPDKQLVLLERNDAGSTKWRFPETPLNSSDTSFESAARRRITEETGMIEVADLRYVSSTKIDDWRFRDSKDGIVLALVRATYVFGAVTPRDGNMDLCWVPIPELAIHLIDKHKPLGVALVKSLAT